MSSALFLFPDTFIFSPPLGSMRCCLDRAGEWGLPGVVTVYTLSRQTERQKTGSYAAENRRVNAELSGRRMKKRFPSGVPVPKRKKF